MNTKTLLVIASMGTSALLAQSGSGAAGAGSASAAGASAGSSPGATSATAPTGTAPSPNVGTAGGSNIGALPTPGVPSMAPTQPSRSTVDASAADPAGVAPGSNALPPRISVAPQTPGRSPLTGLSTSEIPGVSPGTAPIGPQPPIINRGPSDPALVGAPTGVTPRAPTVAQEPVAGAAHAQANPQIGMGLSTVVPTPPPAANADVVMPTANSDPNQVWVPGHYSWVNAQWTWKEGGWQRPPSPGATWVPGNYDPQNHRWTEGHWTQGGAPSRQTPSESAAPR